MTVAALAHWLFDALLVALVLVRQRTIVRLEGALASAHAHHSAATERVEALEAWRHEIEEDPRRLREVERVDATVPELAGGW